jgi:hypothetical protein
MTCDSRYWRSTRPYHVQRWITVRSLHARLRPSSDSLRSQPDNKARRYDRQLRYVEPRLEALLISMTVPDFGLLLGKLRWNLRACWSLALVPLQHPF